ncbi:MAG: MFS transporter [Chloroflexi bacterium]|nr:MFS transporter [Anaerolineaceae bacterium]NMB87090.1 MFS transporter [Chloroflexota bacterium]
MKSSKYRWFVVAVFFTFMLLHQADKLLIGPLTSDIIETFNLTNTQMGAVFTGALIVGAVFYPLWGYFYDRFARSKLLALASLIWGATTWLSAIAPTYPSFLATRASTGVDDSSYPGLYSLISDYFGPQVRGKVYGLLQLTSPLGYLLGMVLALLLGAVLGWRAIFYITGSLGIILAFVIFFGVKDAPRGKSEPEMAALETQELTSYHFSWQIAKDLFRKRSIWLIFLQGFFGVFPWNVITYWFFTYLEKERFYDQTEILMTMVVAVLILAAGYPLGGALGDYFFKKVPSGRIRVAAVGVILGAIFMTLTMNVPLENRFLFGLLLAITAVFIPMASPNVISTVYDITLPEVRSTALAVQYFIESAGAALAPLLAGMIADAFSLKAAIIWICVSTWVLCAIFFTVAIRLIPTDIQTLRTQMRARAELEQQNMAAGLHNDTAFGATPE